MADLSDEVLECIREELTKRPNLAPGVLYHMAQKIEPSIGAGSVRAFHARYVAPIQHELAAAQRQTRKPRKDRKRPPAEPREQERAAETRVHEPAAATEAHQAAAQPERQEQVSRARRSPRRPRRAEASREQIRSVFLQLARDVAGAETGAEIVQVLSRLDWYVDQVMRRVHW